MMAMSDERHSHAGSSISDLPSDALLTYGRSLGLDLDDNLARGELLRLVRARQELVVDLDREAMLDVVIWARRPVRESASKEELVRQIVAVERGKFTGLSLRGLVTLARLRGVDLDPETDRDAVVAALKRAEGIWSRLRRKRRAATGALVAKLARESSEGERSEYQFLPEDNAPSLRDHIEDEGMVGGIARKLRGVADDYVREKLDEIEDRIDRKLDEIDRRLGEWRDREVSNRLKILKITLIVSILVALLGLGYDCVRRSPHREGSPGDTRVTLLECGGMSAGAVVADAALAGDDGRENVRKAKQTG